VQQKGDQGEEEQELEKQQKQELEKQQKEEKKSPLVLPPKYAILQKLGNTLPSLDSRFNMDTITGRAALGIALVLGGTEVYGLLKGPKEFFTIMGGYKKDPKTRKIIYDKMKGFAQFDVDLHGDKIDTPRKYANHLANIITGKTKMPNSRRSRDFVLDLAEKIKSGKIKDEKQLIRWFRANRFGGSNWQGINDGWGRIPGLSNAIIQFISGKQEKQ